MTLVALMTGLIVGCSASRKTTTGDSEIGTTLGGSLGSRKTVGSNRAVSDYMNAQAEQLSMIGAMKTKHIRDQITITWDNATLFDFDSAMLKRESLPDMKSMADVLIQYPKTSILITGHTSAEGEESYNQKLSERQALSVRNYLEEQGVDPSRLETIGYGGLRPVAPNDTEEGRRRNQRVEIVVRADADAIRGDAAE